MTEGRYLVQLPGSPTCTIDPTTVVCIRSTDEGLVVLHTDVGFAVPLRPVEGQTVDELHEMVLEAFAAHYGSIADQLADDAVLARMEPDTH